MGDGLAENMPGGQKKNFWTWNNNWRKLSHSCLADDAVLCFPLDMFDKTRSGQIDLFGFSALWDFMQRWRALFQQFDRDRSGSISGMELQQGNPFVCVKDATFNLAYVVIL